MATEISIVRQGSYGDYAEGQERASRSNRRGELVTANNYQQFVSDGRVFVCNGGVGTTPITFAGAYDADAPDFFLNVPVGTTVIPLRVQVVFDAVGTESTMEIIGLYSNTGDSSATGTAGTIMNMRTDNPRSSNCTATVAIDAAGITDPNAGVFGEFWRFARPLTDTVATTENDRLPLVFTWSAFSDGPAPVIVGNSPGACLAVYAASQAGTGFITVEWVEIPSTSAV
jgi:hypothetical protein